MTIYTVRKNAQGLLPHEKAPAVKQFKEYSQASAYISQQEKPSQYHVTTD